ncbi:MAG: hypothetical protein ABEI54_00525 [Candidatus Bipolaricaulia bacterium]
MIESLSFENFDSSGVMGIGFSSVAILTSATHMTGGTPSLQ